VCGGGERFVEGDRVENQALKIEKAAKVQVDLM
jgi:hypothetical protein